MDVRTPAVAAAVLLAAAACNPAPPQGLLIPAGTDVTLELRDGSRAAGTLVSVEGQEIVLRAADGQQRRISRSNLSAVRLAATTAQNSGGAAAAPTRPKATPGEASPPRQAATQSAFEDHKVPAGMRLSVELRTRIGSSTSRQGDEVRGRLRFALTHEDTELVPAGADVLGAITEATPGVDADNLGRVSLRFRVVEHPGTGSRVAIRSDVLTFEAQVQGRRGNAAPVEIGPGVFATGFDVIVEPGTQVSAQLLDPFIVRIPR
jgi:hypothetical protein